MVIAESAPHIYISALPFAPNSSPVYKQYFSLFPNVLSVKRGQLSNWPAVEMVISDGEERVIQSVAFSQDGQRIVSGSSGGAICVWNATTGAMERSLFQGDGYSIGSVAFSQDGERIVSGSKNGAICVWNTATGTTLEGSPFKGYIDYVIFVAFSQDGQQIIPSQKWGYLSRFPVDYIHCFVLYSI